MLINVLSHHQYHFDMWYYRKMRMIHKKIYAKILFCISYLCLWYDKFLWAIWRGIRKMCTTKFAHERADEGLETKPTLSTSPSLALTLNLTSHPHPHPQVSSCASFVYPSHFVAVRVESPVCPRRVESESFRSGFESSHQCVRGESSYFCHFFVFCLFL
jgi:hypothetical protein